MNAISLLEDQHRTVERLFSLLEKSDGSKKQSVFDELADALAVHSTIEEKIFYPGVKAQDTGSIVEESVQEHLQVKRMLADMLEIEASDQEFEAKCSVLKEQVEHHVEEEEKVLFPAVRKICGVEDLEDLGEQMEELDEHLRSHGSPRAGIPAEIGAAAQV